MSIKQNVTKVLRMTGLLGISDRLRYIGQKIHYRKINNHFKASHPSLKLPPPYFVYETYRLNYAEYYNDGNETAKELASLITQYNHAEQPQRALDWGCGPGRIVRHFSSFLPGYEIYGTDYNAAYIDWCKQNIPAVRFSQNGIQPPGLYENDYFTAVTGLSVFTHLSVTAHVEWIKELCRIIRKDGILVITTQGRSYYDKLLPEEQSSFDKGQIVTREKFKEGHRLYSAFQPKEAIEKLVMDKFNIVMLLEGAQKGDQDLWVLIKK